MSFQRVLLPLQVNLFDALVQSVHWENRPKGVKIAVISRIDADGHIPIVRTTSKYDMPAQHFSPIHKEIAQHIKTVSGINGLQLNHATCEIYDYQYRTMKYHTDQALDIAPSSYICLFSCYDDEREAHLRYLKIKSKETNEESVIELSHNSCVLFSDAVNQAHVHKIEALGSGSTAGGRWMGLTFRQSKTFVEFTDGVPRLVGKDVELRMASEEQQRKFYRLKGMENSSMDHTYPDIEYTISKSDLMPLGPSP